MAVTSVPAMKAMSLSTEYTVKVLSAMDYSQSTLIVMRRLPMTYVT